jgi:hypothetical protein
MIYYNYFLSFCNIGSIYNKLYVFFDVDKYFIAVARNGTLPEVMEGPIYTGILVNIY